MVQSVSVSRCRSWTGRRRCRLMLPPVIVSPEIDAVTPLSIWNTRLALLPVTVTAPAPGPVIVVASARVAQLELAAASGVIVCR